MDNYLMDKEVLCILDTRQIQSFMFRNKEYMDTLGGSDLIIHILNDAIQFALNNIDEPLNENEYDLLDDPDETPKYFESEKIKFQLIISTAGNAICIVRTGRLCSKIIRKISRYYLDHGYSLNIAAAVTEKTDNFGADISHLYRNLNKQKASANISNPIGALPIVIREKNTGDSVIGQDKKTGEYYSKATLIRRTEASYREHIINMNDMLTHKCKSGKEYLAVIHADGNNLGITIGRILQTTADYKTGIRARRKVNKCIKDIYSYILDNTVRELKEYYYSGNNSDSDFEYAFNIIHQGGDDINIICRADMAVVFVESLYKYLKGQCLVSADNTKIPFYICTGIAFVTKDCTFQYAYEMAQDCCDSAKKEAKEEKNLREGLAGNWIDFQVCDSSDSQKLDLLRKMQYITSEDINLCMRPYCIDEESAGEIYNFEQLITLCHKLRSLKLSKTDSMMLSQSYSTGRAVFESWIEDMKDRGIDLYDILGSPLYRDDNRKLHATWYDMIQIMDFIKE